MATMGVVGLRMALIDPITKKVITGEAGLESTTGIFDARGTTAMGVTQANITGLAGTATSIWGNNMLQDKSFGKAQPSVAADFNNLPYEILHKILGDVADGKGGYAMNASGVYPHLAMDIITSDLAGHDIHYGFYDGYVSPSDLNNATNNESQQRQTDNLTYSPLANADGIIMKSFYAADATFKDEALVAELFPAAGKALES